MTSSAALAVGSVLVEAGPDPAAPRWNESAAMDPAVGHSSDPNLLVSSPSAEAEEEEGGVADIVSQAIGHSSDPNLIASPAVEEDEVAADIMSPAIGHSSDPNLISSPVHEEEVDDPLHHPPPKRSSIAIDKEVDERIRRRVEALERRRRSSSGAVQVGIWRSYSLPWNAINATATAVCAAPDHLQQQQRAAGGTGGSHHRSSALPPSNLPPALHGSYRGEARRVSWGSRNAGAAAVPSQEGGFSLRTYDDEDDDDDSQDSDDYSDEESGTEDSSESETETIDPPPGVGGLEKTVDMLKVATDPTVAETETDSERSRSSSSASEDHLSDDELDAPAGLSAGTRRGRRSPRKICGGGGGGSGRKRFHRQCSEMTHITECSESTDGGGAFVSSEDSDDDFEGLRKKSSSETTERRRNRSRSIDSDGSFDVLQVRVQTVPEEMTDLVGKDIVAATPPKEFNGNSSNNDTTPQCQEIDRSLFAIQSVRNLTYARGTDGDGSSGTLGVDVALAIEEEEPENIGEKKKEPENEQLHLTAKEGDVGNEEVTEAAIPDGSTPKRPKKTRAKKKKKKKKRRQRLVMRRAAEEVLHESGFELDLMAPSDIDSSFHSKASTVVDALNSSRHSYGLSFLDSSRHSQGGGNGLSSPPQFFLDSSRHSQAGVAPPFLDSSCHSRGGRGPFAGLDSSRHSRGGGRLRWSSGHGKNKQLRHSAGSSSGMRRSNSLLSLASQNSATGGGGGGNLAVAPPPMTSLGRGCSQASVFSDDTSVGYDNQDNFLDFSIRDYTGIMPEIKRNLSADDLISLAAEDDDEDAVAIVGNGDDGRQQQLFCSAPDGGRFLLLGASSSDESTGLHVLSPPLAEALQSHLPFAVSGQNFWLKYSLVRDGANLMTLLDNVPADSHTILAIETDEGEVFGSFTSSPWRKDWNYYGSGFGAFLWRMKGSRGGGPASSTGSGAEEASPPTSRHRSVFDQTKAEGDIEVFKWSGRNDFTQLLTSEKMAVGGGAEKVADWLAADISCSTTAPGFGLCVDDDMFQGTSSPCATFESPPLSKIHSDGSPFNILNVEVWALTPCISVEEALKMEVMKTFHAEMRSSA